MPTAHYTSPDRVCRESQPPWLAPAACASRTSNTSLCWEILTGVAQMRKTCNFAEHCTKKGQAPAQPGNRIKKPQGGRRKRRGPQRTRREHERNGLKFRQPCTFNLKFFGGGRLNFSPNYRWKADDVGLCWNNWTAALLQRISALVALTWICSPDTTIAINLKMINIIHLALRTTEMPKKRTLPYLDFNLIRFS